MTKSKFVLNYEGVGQLLKSPEMMAVCREYADQILARTNGDGYEISEYTGRKRVNVSVGAVSKEAIKDNAENNTLLHALGGGEG